MGISFLCWIKIDARCPAVLLSPICILSLILLSHLIPSLRDSVIIFAIITHRFLYRCCSLRISVGRLRQCVNTDLRYPWMVLITRSWLPLDNIPMKPRPIIGICRLAAKAPYFIFKQWYMSGTGFATYHCTCLFPCIRIYEYTRQFRPLLRVFSD